MKECQSQANSKWIGNSCYFFNTEVKSYEDAQDYCQFHFMDLNSKTFGKLYEPKSIKEFRSMYKTAREMYNGRFKGFWIGINDVDIESSFKYASNTDPIFGEPQARLPWAKKQPDGGENENCILALKSRWHDYDCDSVAWSICELSNPL